MTESKPRLPTPVVAAVASDSAAARVAELSGLHSGAARVGTSETSRTDGLQAPRSGTTRSPVFPVDPQAGAAPTSENGTTTGSDELLPKTPPLPVNALDPLPLPKVDLPPVDLPPVDLPPIDPPPVDLPPIEVPPVEVPGGAVPPVEVDPVDVPPVDLPPVDVPPLDVPPLLP